MRYGQRPEDLGAFRVECNEMLFYQYLPIKLKGRGLPQLEERIECFKDLINTVCRNFTKEFGLDEYFDSYVYLTVKNKYQVDGCSFNRKGYHSDGFMTNDVNYIWCDRNPTTFNFGKFVLTLNDTASLIEMEQQAQKSKEYQYPDNTLLRLNQYNIHKVTDNGFQGMRCFVKISFSKDKYNLFGNSKNYLLDYDWEMIPRELNRNIPQSNISK